MSDSELEKKMEELLEGELARYSGAEARPGLEVRILSGLAEAQQQHSRWTMGWPVWSTAFAVCCLVVTALWIGTTSKKTAHVLPIAMQPVVPEQTELTLHNIEPVVDATRHAGTVSVIGKRDRRRISPRTTVVQHEPEIAGNRQPAFSTPTPLSEQEQLLFSYLRQTPLEELRQLSKPNELEPAMEPTQELNRSALPESENLMEVSGEK